MSMHSEFATIHNIRLDKHFTMLSNRTPEDPNLSWAAKGLLWYLLSRSPDWSIHVWQLAEIYQGSKKGGKKDAIQEILKELRQSGYVKYTKSKKADGRWHHRYDVYPVKIEHFQKMFPERDFPDMDHPATVNPVVSPRNDLPRNDLPNIYPKSSSSEASSPHTSNDDACGADDDLRKKEDAIAKEDFSEVTFTRSNGDVGKLTQTEIYQFFLKKPFSTEIIRKSIQRLREVTGPINNALKYLESVCKSIQNELKSKPKSNENKEKPERREKIKEETITFEEYFKCQNQEVPPIFRSAKP